MQYSNFAIEMFSNWWNYSKKLHFISTYCECFNI